MCVWPLGATLSTVSHALKQTIIFAMVIYKAGGQKFRSQTPMLAVLVREYVALPSIKLAMLTCNAVVHSTMWPSQVSSTRLQQKKITNLCAAVLAFMVAATFIPVVSFILRSAPLSDVSNSFTSRWPMPSSLSLPYQSFMLTN